MKTDRPSNDMAATALEAEAGRRLLDSTQAAAKAGCSYREWLRLTSQGAAPKGVLLGKRLRRWDERALSAWIAAGCPPVGVALKEGSDANAK